MLASVQFNDQFPAWSAKVNDVVTDGMLIPKMDIAHTVRTQVFPKFGFRFGHVAMKLFGAPEDFRRGAFMQLDPRPPPCLPQKQTPLLGEGEQR